MLRWLVLGLLLCNLIYFFWARQSSFESAATAVAAPAATGARLSLLREVKSSSPVKPSHDYAQPLASLPVSVCHMIGPFKEKISARQIKDRLRALGIEVATYQLSIPEKPDYWVHLGPLRSRREALEMLRELQGKKIDSFLITEGELVNGVSLGFFTKVELAQAVQKQRREQGYDAKVHQIPRFTLQFWEVIAGDQHGRLSEELWQKVKAGTDGLELRKNSCDLIASAERLD